MVFNLVNHANPEILSSQEPRIKRLDLLQLCFARKLRLHAPAPFFTHQSRLFRFLQKRNHVRGHRLMILRFDDVTRFAINHRLACARDRAGDAPAARKSSNR